MAQDVIVNFSSNLAEFAESIDESKKKVDGLNKSVEKTNKELEQVEKGGEGAAKAVNEVAKGESGIKGVASELGNAVRNTSLFGSALSTIAPQFGAFTNFIGVLRKTRDGLIANKVATEGLAKGAGVGAKAFRVLRLAIASTGIGLLVIALGSIITFFTSTQRGADQLRAKLAGLGEFFGVFRDIISGVGETLVNAFSDPIPFIRNLGDSLIEFILNPLEGIKKAGDAVIEGLKTVARANQARIKTEELTLQLIRTERDLRQEISILNSEERIRSTQLLRLARNRTLTDQQRIEALREAGKIETAAFDRTLKNLEDELAIRTILASFTDTDEKTQEKLVDLQVRINELQAQRIDLLENISNREDQILEQGRARREADERKRIESLQRLAQNEEALLQKTDQIRRDIFLDSIKNETEREIQELRFRLQDELKALQDNEDQRVALIRNTAKTEQDLIAQTAQARSITTELKLAIEQKFAQDLKALTEESAKSQIDLLQVFLNQRRLALLKDVEAGLITNQQFQAELIKADIEVLQARLAQLDSFAEEALLVEAELVQRRIDLLQLEKQQRDAAAAEEKARIEERKSATIEAVQAITSALNTLNDADIARADRLADAQRAALDSLRERQRAGEKISADEIRANEERLQALSEQREKFVRRQREIAQAELVINSVVAISKAVAAGDPFTAGLRVAAILATLVAGLAAARSQAEGALPAFATGVVDYQGKGTGTSDSNVVRISRGESIITADATKKHRAILEAMNGGSFNAIPWHVAGQPSLLPDQIRHQKNLETKLDRVVAAIEAGRGGGVLVQIGDRDIAGANSRYNAKFDRAKNKARL